MVSDVSGRVKAIHALIASGTSSGTLYERRPTQRRLLPYFPRGEFESIYRLLLHGRATILA
jgi:hypothetical protein